MTLTAIVIVIVAIVIFVAVIAGISATGKLSLTTGAITFAVIILLPLGIIVFAFFDASKEEEKRREIALQEKINSLEAGNSQAPTKKSYYYPGEKILLQRGDVAIIKTKASYTFQFEPLRVESKIVNLAWERTGWDSDLSRYDIKVWNKGSNPVEFRTIEFLKK